MTRAAQENRGEERRGCAEPELGGGLKTGGQAQPRGDDILGMRMSKVDSKGCACLGGELSRKQQRLKSKALLWGCARSL